MYPRILKKDLKQKKTMNMVLLVFIILAATFIASSVNNMVSVMTALDVFLERAEVPDHWIALVDLAGAKQMEQFVEENHYEYKQQEYMQIDPKDVEKGNGALVYSNTACISRMADSTKIFGQDDREITKVKDGEIYVTSQILNSEGLKAGDRIKITANGKQRSFTVAGGVKDALFGSAMIGITRFLVSDRDFAYFNTADAEKIYSFCIYTDAEDFEEQFNKLQLKVAMSAGRDMVKNLYLMDMVIAAVMLVVSVCLVLISMVILRFTIHFTMSEEFREIGVMKAIGIRNHKIRLLYILKYFAVSTVGGVFGFFLSIPFGKMMLGNLSQNIILSGDANIFLNLLFSVLVVVVVVLFCYSCTRKIKSFSPIDAIRNGENGERYTRKSILHLSKSKFPAVPFLACNDIFSGIRRYAAMILIFTLGILLVIIPVDTINTLQSGHLITWFSMAECDYVINKEQIFNETSSHKLVEDNLDNIREKLAGQGIKAAVYQEIMFRMNISYRGKHTSSLAFQGVGDVTAAQYAYLEGSAPMSREEVGISHVIAKKLDAGIGDTIEIQDGVTTKKYMVTAILQTMNNMGEGIRFFQDEQLDYSYALGSFGIQIKYMDHLSGSGLDDRKEQLITLFPDYDVFTASGYVNEMTGDIGGQMQGLKQLILMVVLCINILVTVLMVKSFLTKEKGEIALLKAIGFRNASLVAWQTLRIGMVLLISVVAGTLLSTPLSQLSVGPVFQSMGAQSIEFSINPLEVYIIYPFTVLGVTVLASTLTALQLRKIPASEAAEGV